MLTNLYLKKKKNSIFFNKNKIVNKYLSFCIFLTFITIFIGLALGLGEEIDSQNDLVENILGKADKADINMERQNKEINRILKK